MINSSIGSWRNQATAIFEHFGLADALHRVGHHLLFQRLSQGLGAVARNLPVAKKPLYQRRGFLYGALTHLLRRVRAGDLLLLDRGFFPYGAIYTARG